MKKVVEKPGKSERNDDKNMRTMGCNNIVLSKRRGLNKNVFPYLGGCLQLELSQERLLC